MRHVSYKRGIGCLKESIWVLTFLCKYVHTDQQIADILTKSSFPHEIWDELMILFGIVSENFHHRSNLSVVATLVLLVLQMANRSRPSIHEALKFGGA